jgi:hypothetical protein
MTSSTHTYAKYTLATVFFAMCFMLTPRAWVDGRDVSGETVPVHMLDGPGEGCLWCAPLVPVECAREEPGAEGPELDRLQLHPDEAPVDPADLPCVDPEDAAEEEGPSA